MEFTTDQPWISLSQEQRRKLAIQLERQRVEADQAHAENFVAELRRRGLWPDEGAQTHNN